MEIYDLGEENDENRISDAMEEEINNRIIKIANSAYVVNRCMYNIYISVENMRHNWYGKAYDNLIQILNEYVSELNRFFYETVERIPTQLFYKLQAHSNVTYLGFSGINKGLTTRLEYMTKTNTGSKFSFKSEAVDSKKDLVNNYCYRVNSECEQIINEIRYVDWSQIEAVDDIYEMETYIRRIKSYSNTIRMSLEKRITNMERELEKINYSDDIEIATREFTENMQSIQANLQDDLKSLENRILDITPNIFDKKKIKKIKKIKK